MLGGRLSRGRQLCISVAIACLCLLGFSYSSAEAVVGTPAKSVDASTQFEAEVARVYPNAAEQNKWISEHYKLVRGWFPWASRWVASGIPITTTIDPALDHYSGGNVSPLTEASRRAEIAGVEAAKAEGAAGVFIDDMNFGCSYRDGNQEKDTACTASGGEPEKKEEATLIEEARKVFPSGVVVINTQWHEISGEYVTDPQVKRAIANMTIYDKEFGVGHNSGIKSVADYEAMLTFYAYLHEHGKSVAFSDEGDLGEGEEEYGLATYLVFDNGGDYISPEHGWPGALWKGLEISLGEPVNLGDAGGKYIRITGPNGAGLGYRRIFGTPNRSGELRQYGMVAVNPPGASRTDVSYPLLGSYRLPSPLSSTVYGSAAGVSCVGTLGIFCASADTGAVWRESK